MPQPLLVAHTPRAGRYNHRYLVPPGTDLPDSVLGDFFAAAAAASRGGAVAAGANYLAAIRPAVKQQTTDRRGDETLLLLGVNVQRLRLHTRQALESELRSRFGALESLVAAVDWDQCGQRMLVQRPELDAWLRALPGRLPVHRTVDRPLPLRPARARTWMAYIAAAALAAVAAAAMLRADFGAPPPATSQGPPSTSTPDLSTDGAVPAKPIPKEDLRARYDALVSRWDKTLECNKTKAQAELLSAAGIESQGGGTAVPQALLDNPEVKELLRSKQEEQPYVFVKDKVLRDTLKSFVEPPADEKKIVEARKKLEKMAEGLHRLRNHLIDANVRRIGEYEGPPGTLPDFANLLRTLAGDDFQIIDKREPCNPRAPIFTEAEAKEFDALEKCAVRILQWCGKSECDGSPIAALQCERGRELDRALCTEIGYADYFMPKKAVRDDPYKPIHDGAVALYSFLREAFPVEGDRPGG